ncbi:hypothetical protein PDIG_29380 [Penicillium digitatum PHI26]|uniref:Uncharacterized protein n=2 Tax=Penicillium digitatum TaxID=36651 RepID=K9G0T2_PEND2|nr:hypothetical protein PDIP_63810 [Penicillium digitatum Pd1]EKV09701.1 hypothetical protein PDIP_63810 [Penicillium digitatum Pd1]EKV14979.1 hypothetical protein PDIG_29380 [Penicillium digitatum PHI26]
MLVTRSLMELTTVNSGAKSNPHSPLSSLMSEGEWSNQRTKTLGICFNLSRWRHDHRSKG